jgi:hypothetical protein
MARKYQKMEVYSATGFVETAGEEAGVRTDTSKWLGVGEGRAIVVNVE